MTVYICRDYSAATTGFTNNYFHASYMYLMAIFIRRVLGYSYVGSTSFNLDDPVQILTVTDASFTTPITITTATPHGFSNDTTHSVFIAGVSGNSSANGAWGITVTGANTFTLKGSSGNNTYSGGGTVTSGFLYTSGLVTDGYGTGINFGAGAEKEVSVPIEKRKVVVGDIGKIMVLKGDKYPTKNVGLFKISNINVGTATTIAVGSNGASLPQSTINVASTAGFATSGTIFVTTSTGTFPVTYTGTTGTSFTGCAGGSGTMSTGGQVCTLNRYIIDYRSTENPPAEANNSLDWWLYEIENAAGTRMVTSTYSNSLAVGNATNTSPIQITTSSHGFVTGEQVTISGVVGNTAANGTWNITVTGDTTFTLDGSTGNGTFVNTGASVFLTGYQGDGLRYGSRLILQSPHSTGWQVRIAVEPTNSGNPLVTFTTGFSGNAVGDFLPGTPQTHVAQFYNVNIARNTAFGNITPGTGVLSTALTRITIVGDGYGQNIFAYTRSSSGDGILNFGLPDNEPVPLPVTTERTYTYGSTNNAVLSSYAIGGIAMRPGVSANTGTAFRGQPRFCLLTGWANLDGTTLTSPIFSGNAGDTPFTSATEVLPIEIWSGTLSDIALSQGAVPPMFFDQVFMGTVPALRLGRANFGNFTLSTEEVTSRTVAAATNASPIQITTSVANALTTGQTVTISGVQGNTAANGTWVITVINNQNFTLNNSTGNGTYTAGGTVNGTPRWLHMANGLYLQWNGTSGLTA